MSGGSRRRSLLLTAALLLGTNTAAFVPSPYHTFSSSSTNKEQSLVQQLNAIIEPSDAAEVIFPSVLFLASVAASVFLSRDKEKDESSTLATTSSSTASSSSSSTTFYEEEEEEEEKPEETYTPPVEEPVDPFIPSPSVTETTRFSAPPSSPPPKSFSDLRKEVASTVYDVRATQARIKKRAAEDLPPAFPSLIEEEEGEFDESSFEPEPIEEERPKKRSIIRQGFRFLKKVVFPWRKWENIN